MTGTPRLVIRCQDHPSYRGLTKVQRDCDGCAAVRAMRGSSIRVHVSFRAYGDPENYDTIVRWGSA